MATRGVLGVRRLAPGQSDISRNLRRAALGVSGLASIGGVVALPHNPRLGLLATAVILGWTQLAGL